MMNKTCFQTQANAVGFQQLKRSYICFRASGEAILGTHNDKLQAFFFRASGEAILGTQR